MTVNGDSDLGKSGITTAVANSEITYTRPLALKVSDSVPHPEIGRADTTASVDKPSGDADYTKRFKDFVCLPTASRTCSLAVRC